MRLRKQNIFDDIANTDDSDVDGDGLFDSIDNDIDDTSDDNDSSSTGTVSTSY